MLKLRPGIRPRFFSQKMAAKLPEKKMPWNVENYLLLIKLTVDESQ